MLTHPHSSSHILDFYKDILPPLGLGKVATVIVKVDYVVAEVDVV